MGESTFYRLLHLEQEKPAEVMVRFERVAGEFAQFDFGEGDVRLLSGKRRRIHSAAYRLKYSRWMWVTVVTNEWVEALVRALLAPLEQPGGVPLRVVFDRLKTVAIGFEDRRPIWNEALAQVAIDYGFSIELCAPSKSLASRHRQAYVVVSENRSAVSLRQGAGLVRDHSSL